jgi:hypothetical protein
VARDGELGPRFVEQADEQRLIQTAIASQELVEPFGGRFRIAEACFCKRQLPLELDSEQRQTAGPFMSRKRD